LGALAVFHLPLFFYRGDAVGVYDIYLLTYALLFSYFGGISIGRFKSYYWLLIVYLGYIGFSTMFTGKVFSVLLLAKQIQHFLLIVIAVDFFQSTRKPDGRLLDILLLIFGSAIVYQMLYLRGIVPGLGVVYQLGMPFAEGASSNPGGFFIAAFIILIYEVAIKRYGISVLRVVVLLIAFYGLWLTISRVNLLGLMFALGVSVLHTLGKQPKGWVYLLLLGLLVTSFYLFVLPNIPDMGINEKFLKIIRDPRTILLDGSLGYRLEYHWPNAVEVWLSSVRTFAFGVGYGMIPVVDGTYHRLLVNQGLVGFGLFWAVWLGWFVRYHLSKPLIIMGVFVMVNAITSDTLISSFRSIQPFVLILVGLIFFSDNSTIVTNRTSTNEENAAHG